VLATFMGGLCIGQSGAPGIVKGTASFWRHPFRTYAAIEFFHRGVRPRRARADSAGWPCYLTVAAGGFAGMLLRGVGPPLSVAPTILMGASSRSWRAGSKHPRAASRGGAALWRNIFGAVCGCLIAGFYLLRLFRREHRDLHRKWPSILRRCGSFLAAVATLAPSTGRSRRAESRPPQTGSLALDDLSRNRAFGCFGAGRGSGVDAADGIDAGATVYAFSIILAVFWGPRHRHRRGFSMVRGLNRASRWLVEMFAAAGIAWAAYAIAMPALLADQSAAFEESDFHLPDRHGARDLAISRDVVLGREFPFRLRRGRRARTGFRRHGRGRLMREYRARFSAR